VEAAKLTLEYLKVLVWPVVASGALFWYRNAIGAALSKTKVKLSLFGVDVEANIAELERTLTAATGGTLSEAQWSLLQKISQHESVSVAGQGYKMSMQGDLPWIRPLRNAGLIMTLPDGKYIEQATDLVLTPLGKLLMTARAASSKIKT
jgi:hypothetical protein